MKIVSNTGPTIGLVKIGKLDLLKILYFLAVNLRADRSVVGLWHCVRAHLIRKLQKSLAGKTGSTSCIVGNKGER